MTTETEAALALSINNMDASRRVGWAKAFAAERSNEELSRDLNMARSDLEITLKTMAFLYGATLEANPALLAMLPNEIDHSLIRSILPPALYNAGRRAGRVLVRREHAGHLTDPLPEGKTDGGRDAVRLGRFKAVQKIARRHEAENKQLKTLVEKWRNIANSQLLHNGGTI